MPDLLQLSGFNDLERDQMIVLKKVVGNYISNFSGFGEVVTLSLNLKKVHETEASAIYEIKANLEFDKDQYHSSSENRNLFVSIDDVMKKLETQIKSDQ
ncbi:MAG: hypothetical protein ACOCP8_00430 [archaeon]